MARQHRRRTLIGRFLDWYYGPLDFIEDRRFPRWLEEMKQVAVDTNLKFAQMLGILSPLLSPV